MKMDLDNTTVDCVLMVDQDVVVRASLAAYLRDCGLHVIEASDTVEAEKVLSQGNSQVDIVLCDAGSLGAEPSFAFAQWVRANCKDTPVLLAGSIDSAAAFAGDLCDEGPHLTKPYDHAQLVDTIKQALARKNRNTIA